VTIHLRAVSLQNPPPPEGGFPCSVPIIRKLSQYFRLIWEKKRVRKGFFLRAEDFFGYAKRMAQLRAELENDLAQVDREYQGRSKLAADLARMPYARETQNLQQRYGEGLDSASHGESFLNLFRSRFVFERPAGFSAPFVALRLDNPCN
jgi:predicted ATPase